MNKTLGIVGGGQLGRMLAQAAIKLGVKVIVLDPTPNSPAGQVTSQIVGNFKDEKKILELAEQTDFITFEIELAGSETLQQLAAKGKVIRPSPTTLGIIKNKYGQKEFLAQAKIPVADFLDVEGERELREAADKFGYPLVLKAKFDAYDGRGNASISGPQDISSALQKLAGRELYVEKFVPFEKELAVVAVRSADGKIITYPVVQTIHKNHICHMVLAPAPIADTVIQQAEKLAKAVLKHLHGIGVFCVEMFLAPGGQVLVNEIAPRVHNAGHLTIEACATSQFENHARAVADLELGAADLKAGAAAMINILGQRQGPANFPAFDGSWQDFARRYGLPGVDGYGDKIFVHIYGKLETKPERKMGHLTVLADHVEAAQEIGEKARSLINI